MTLKLLSLKIMDPTAELNLILPLALVLVPFLYLIFKHLFISGPPLPPGPTPWPIIGNILQIGTKPHISMAKFAQLHGPLISLKLGTQLIVIGSSPSAAAEILKTNDRLLSARSAPDVVFLKGFDVDRLSLIWVDCNDRWRSLRALLRTHLFSNRALESTAVVREAKTADLMKFLGTRQGHALEIAHLVSTTVYNSITTLLLSKDFCYFEDDVPSVLKETMTRAQQIGSTPNLADLYPVFSRFDLQGIKKETLVVTKQISATWEDTVRERRESNYAREQPDVLDTLIANGFADDQINYVITELLSTGTDTVVSTVEWAMAELMKNREAMEKARQDIARELETNQDGEGDLIKETHLPKLLYLLACVMETLRLNPVAPLLLPHRALETCEVMNYTIPKDTRVFVNVWAIGRDPEVWEDALSFKPERFLDSKMNFQGQDFEYLPFGSGRRICPGYPLATKQVLLVLANLIHHFDWHLPNNEDPQGLDMSGKFGITLHMEKPLCLIPSSRTRTRTKM